MDRSEIQKVAWKILEYLGRNPDAMDTEKGIAQWWVRDDLKRVRAALALLVDREILQVRTLNGYPYYFLGKRQVEKRLPIPLGPIRGLILALVLGLGYLIAPAPAWAAALNWVGGTSSDLGTAANWNPAQAPTAADSCMIDSFTTFQPVVTSNVICGSLSLGTGGTVVTLTFSGSQNLTISGNVTIGANGRVAPSGVPTGVFTTGGNWLDDPLTTNFTSPNLHLRYVFNSASQTISTNESFYDVQTSGTLALSSDLTIANTLTIPNVGTLTHGAHTITLNGTGFSVAGAYVHDCSSLLVINGSIGMGGGDHYPNVTINAGGVLNGAGGAYIDCDMTLQAGGTFQILAPIYVGGDWINNGGTFVCGNGTVNMIGAGARIRGTAASTWFHNLTVGDGPGDSTTAETDIQVTTDLVVTAGSTFTLQASRNIQVTRNTTVNGTLNLSGTSTWTQTGGNNTGITVAAGGLLSAQGTDAANRVTFTSSGGTLYDLVINGGIAFSYANVYYTHSAAATAGLTINSPPVATVSLDYIAFNFTEKVNNNSVMLRWNSAQTVYANGVTFDSPSFLQADSDVNVDARSGAINFTNYGGNYAGEALDLDNGGFANWLFNVTKQVWEENGSAPLASPVSAPVGSTLVFLVYVKNPTATTVTDIRINDNLDEAGFAYVAGSLRRTNNLTPPSNTASDLAIFTATGNVSSQGLLDGVDADVASAMDTGGPAGPDRITVGAATGQANAPLDIAANSTFALRFKVRVR